VKRAILAVVAALFASAIVAPMLSARQSAPVTLRDRIDKDAAQVAANVIAWRRDFHQHPELGNREVRTARIVAEHLRSLGVEVRTGIATTGVVGVLRGGRPGPVVALRADMDALPVTEETDLPFKSTVTAEFNGRQVGVMHACGHDAHTAILMGTATVLAGMRADVPGTVVFLFQPAEEGAPAGEDGGAEVMVAQGALDNPKVEAIFGLHVFPFDTGGIWVRPDGFMAGGDTVKIVVRGRQTHGAQPWAGVDPIVVAAQVVLGLQTIISRQTDLTAAPAVLTLGIIEGGNRTNIIPDEVRMSGTLRTFDKEMRLDIQQRVRRTATNIAEAAGASAEVSFVQGNVVTFNDPALTARIIPTLRRVATGPFEPNAPVLMPSEDFSQYQLKVPGVFFQLGVSPRDSDPKKREPNHSPRFFVDEGALVTGVRALANLVFDYGAGSR
jgi:amidohydrolase